MQIISLDECYPGLRMVGVIYKNSGLPVFVRGVKLTSGMITTLKNNGVINVYIRDELDNHLEVQEGYKEQFTEYFQEMEERIDRFSLINNRSKFDMKKIIKCIQNDVLMDLDIVDLLLAIKNMDEELFLHSVNVSAYSIILAAGIGLSDDAIKEIGIGALLHDVGKMLIPKSVLYKGGKLTDKEFEIIKTHTILGYDILKYTTSISKDSAQCAFHHHERLDKSGYPSGLSGTDIHSFAKIIAVSDVFDAVTMNRIYQKAMLPHIALEILKKSSPQQLDSRLVKLFPRIIALYPPGLMVSLNTGHKGVVEKYNPNYPSKPLVKVITSENGKVLDVPYCYDLANSKSKKITSSNFYNM